MTDQEKEVQINLMDAPTELVFVYYSLSVIHEKWKMAGWCQKELQSRGFSNATIAGHTKVFKLVYDKIIDPQNDTL